MPTDIQTIHLLRSQSQEVLTRICQCAIAKRFQAYEAISWQSDPCEYVYFILKGEVEIYRLSPAGREQILDRLGQGGCFNLVSALLDNALNQSNARALTACEILVLGKSDFNQMLKQFPGFALATTHFFAERLARMTDLIETLSLYSVRQRVAKFLINQADSQEKINSIRWTQTDMAKRLGTVRDVIGRTLRKFADEGLVRFEREKIMLLDRQGLEKAATGEE
ncbi:MAG: Crp/Fnr family transcriptional regulator [Anaerolineaceae bacterium]|jgi:CRP/FNR family transcriptional regulator|nr:Crp/Fnr family transcriptional regulator [Anaerolineaceae bacterium]